MKAFSLTAFLLALATSTFALSPEELLAQIDDRRYIPDMTFSLRITSYEGDKKLDSECLLGFSKTSDGKSSVLISFVEPASVKGRKMLMDGNTVYLLFPKTKNPIRLSPLQVLLGQTSNGDVARTGFARDYDVTALAEAGRDGVACYLFSLEAKPARRESTYKRISLWVEKSTQRPIYAEFFSTSDAPFKKALYKNYSSAEGKDLPFVLDIYDGENPQKHTIMAYDRIGTKALPETAFRREYLESWLPEQLR